MKQLFGGLTVLYLILIALLVNALPAHAHSRHKPSQAEMFKAMEKFIAQQVMTQWGQDPSGTTRNVYVLNPVTNVWMSIGSFNASTNVWTAGGTVTCGSLPALTGDVTTTAGSCATTVAAIQGKVVSGTTGTGNVVFSTGPTLTLTNATGLPIAGLTGLGTGVASALALNVGSAGAPVVFNGAGGTPTSLTLTNATGLPNAGLTNSSVTLGTTNVALGGTATTIAGLSLSSTGSLGTPSAIMLTNGTGLPLTGLAAQVTNSIVGNATSGSASPTALSIGSCSGATNALIWTTNTGFGCNTLATGGTVSSVAAGTGMSFTTITTTGSVAIDKATAANMYAGAFNKVLTADNVFTAEVAVTFNASQALDFSTFLNGSVTLTGNITSLTCSNMKAGQAGVIRFIQDGTGTRTMVSTWCTAFVWQAGTKGTLSTPASTIDALFYQCVSTTVCLVSLGKAFL